MPSTLPHPTDGDARCATVTVVQFENERDTVPKLWVGPAGDLLGAAHEIRQTKAGGRCISFATYKDGARRGNSGVESVTALAFDLDHVTDTHLAAAWTWLVALLGFMYTSFSDRLASVTDRCARLVVLLKRPVTPAEARQLYAHLVPQLPFPVDAATMDAARIWYAPSTPASTAPGAFIAYTAGVLLDPDPLLAAARIATVSEQQAPKPSTDWREVVANGSTPGGRHAAIVKLAAHLIGKKVDPVVVLNLVIAWNKVKNSPPKPDEEVIAAVNYVAGRELDRREGRHDR
jgi:hypothetical protein